MFCDGYIQGQCKNNWNISVGILTSTSFLSLGIIYNVIFARKWPKITKITKMAITFYREVIWMSSFHHWAAFLMLFNEIPIMAMSMLPFSMAIMVKMAIFSIFSRQTSGHHWSSSLGSTPSPQSRTRWSPMTGYKENVRPPSTDNISPT